MSPPHQPITLSKDIVAMAVERSPEGRTARHTGLTQLQTGTEVTIVGKGFNKNTVRVRCDDQSYFVYLTDIEEPDSSYYLP